MLRRSEHGIESREMPLKIAVKQYVECGQNQMTVHFTMIFAGRTGVAKASYEPLFEYLCESAPVLSVWAADAAHCGASYVLN